MFWIVYTSDTELTINNRIDEYYNVYNITYRAEDNSIYAPPQEYMEMKETLIYQRIQMMELKI
ncbi:MAG: hypothetical protein ACP5PT_02585 [Brevinematia bacterium]